MIPFEKKLVISEVLRSMECMPSLFAHLRIMLFEIRVFICSVEIFLNATDNILTPRNTRNIIMNFGEEIRSPKNSFKMLPLVEFDESWFATICPIPKSKRTLDSESRKHKMVVEKTDHHFISSLIKNFRAL
jgi:hypothetical protein